MGTCQRCGGPLPLKQYPRKFCDNCWGHTYDARRTCVRCGEPKTDGRRPLCHTCANAKPHRAPNERDLTMGRMYASGMPLVKVGKAFGVTGERIRQLLAKYTDVERRKGKDWDDLSAHQQYVNAPRSHWPREGLRAFKRAHGYCTSHHGGKCLNKAEPGRTMCAKHLRLNVARSVPLTLAKRRERIAAGLCPTCGGTPRPGRQTCQPCAEHATATTARYNQRRKALASGNGSN